MFFEKRPIFERGLYRHVYWLNVGLCGASFYKNLTNKKQENLLYILKFLWKQD